VAVLSGGVAGGSVAEGLVCPVQRLQHSQQNSWSKLMQGNVLLPFDWQIFLQTLTHHPTANAV
jgi:hypothetical protein